MNDRLFAAAVSLAGLLIGSGGTIAYLVRDMQRVEAKVDSYVVDRAKDRALLEAIASDIAEQKALEERRQRRAEDELERLRRGLR